MVALILISILSFGDQAFKEMPVIKPKKSAVVKSADEGRNLSLGSGFGADEDKVKSMNLMMVEGAPELPAAHSHHHGH